MRSLVLVILVAVFSVPSVLAADLAKGKLTYEKSCAMCHKSGIAGSPKLDDKAAWVDRLAQGEEELIEHSLKGFRGSKGYMPPKGGKASLSDAEVTDAVKYMISEVQ